MVGMKIIKDEGIIGSGKQKNKNKRYKIGVMNKERKNER